jgi:hypothetical protein
LTERQEALTESLVARLTQLPETLQVSIMRQLSQVRGAVPCIPLLLLL